MSWLNDVPMSKKTYPMVTHNTGIQKYTRRKTAKPIHYEPGGNIDNDKAFFNRYERIKYICLYPFTHRMGIKKTLNRTQPYVRFFDAFDSFIEDIYNYRELHYPENATIAASTTIEDYKRKIEDTLAFLTSQKGPIRNFSQELQHYLHYLVSAWRISTSLQHKKTLQTLTLIQPRKAEQHDENEFRRNMFQTRKHEANRKLNSILNRRTMYMNPMRIT